MDISYGNLKTLFTAFSSAFQEGFGGAPKDHETFTMTVQSASAESEYGWLGQFPTLREWAGERVFRSIALHGYAIRNRKFESTVQVNRDTIEDDQYGVYTPMFHEMGLATMAHISELCFDALRDGFNTPCYDGQYFFDTDHPVTKKVGAASVSNYQNGAGTPWFLVDNSRMIKPIIFQDRIKGELLALDQPTDDTVFKTDLFAYGVRARCNVGYGFWQLAYASKANMTADNYVAAREAMMKFKGDEGRPLGIKPTHLIVGPTLEEEARQLLVADRLANGASNVWAGSADLIVSPWLD